MYLTIKSCRWLYSQHLSNTRRRSNIFEEIIKKSSADWAILCAW